MFGLFRSFFNYAQDTLGTIGLLPLTTKPLQNALILSTLNFHILAGFRLGLKIEFMNIIVKPINQVMLVN